MYYSVNDEKQINMLFTSDQTCLVWGMEIMESSTGVVV
jgi:hypothetical protein